jgi:hypothetical protein
MMNANHLLEDELDYELRIRKVVVGEAETIPNKQRLLRAALRPVSGAEQQISITMQEDPESEFFVVTDKMKYITTVLEESGAKAKDFATLEARMIHLLSRLDRIRLLVGENRKFDITVSVSAIKRLLQLYFPKSVGFPEGKKPQSNKLDISSGAVKKTIASPKIADPFSETNLGQDPLNDTLQNLKLDEHPFLPVQRFSKLSTKEQEKYLQAMRTLQYLKAKVSDKKLLEEMENLDNSVDMSEQEKSKTVYETKIKHNESQDENQNSIENIDSISKEVNEKSKFHKTIGKHSDATTMDGRSFETKATRQHFYDQENSHERSPIWRASKVHAKRGKEVRWRDGSPNQVNGRHERPVRELSSGTSDSERNEVRPEHSILSGKSRSRFEGFYRSSATDSSSEETDSGTDARRHRSTRRKNEDDSRQLPVSRWNVKFSADDNVSLVDFLRQVTMFANSERITESQLLQKAGHLFKGTALEWYMSATASDQFKKWKHLVRRLKEAFLPEYNDSYLLQECERRVQLKTETFEIYLAKMNRLFDGLSYVLPEKAKLSILKQNLKPSHKIGVAMLDIRSVEELRKYCRRLDGLDPSLYMRPQVSTSIRPNFNHRQQICELEQVEDIPKKKGRNRKKIPTENNLLFTTRGVCGIENRAQSQQAQSHRVQSQQAQSQQAQSQQAQSQSQQAQSQSQQSQQSQQQYQRPNFNRYQDYQPQPQRYRNQRLDFQEEYPEYQQQYRNRRNNDFRPSNRNYQRSFNNRRSSQEHWGQRGPSVTDDSQNHGAYNAYPNYDRYAGGETVTNQKMSGSNQANFARNTNPFLDNWAAEITGQNTGPTQRTSPQQSFSQQQHQTFVQQQPTFSQQLIIPKQQQPQSQLCWNCDLPNHSQRECMAPRRVFCFLCGRKDVYANTCPTCSGNLSQRMDSGARLSL